MLVMHTVIAIAAVVLLIIKFKIDPVISLVVGSIYLGLAGGVGFPGTVEAITKGFGSIMASVGLLIGFGVLIGALLHTTGAFTKMVRVLLRIFGPTRIPYGLALALATVFPSIYVDVQVVLAAPVARQAAKHMGPNGLALVSGALGIGIFSGYVFVVPGLSAISIAGLMNISLGKYLLFGMVIGPVTALLTVIVFRQLLRLGWWNAAKDEEESEALLESEARAQAADLEESTVRTPPLALSLLPIAVPLAMIAFGAFAELFDFSNQFIEFIGNANIALFVGLVMAFALALRTVGREGANEAFGDGLQTSGEILLVTGIGGSLGAVIKATGLASVLAGMFDADAGAPVVVSILLAWFIAALLHLAIGSVSVAAITAAGIVAPLLGQMDVNPVAVGLGIASGSLFALHVNSNFFWMFKSLLGLSTSGSLKTMTTVTTIGSLLSLPMVIGIGLVA
ncbi:H+/gluconate symporter-like permease [Luteococcus japonicus]|uniref:H+/gluconate symporter-like permease n=1 Tax=Luteococcus japonicus TaxID=33984 RepID=A0A3N1ZQF7_9ACTN|nr:SLC13 family permease [Luteococcus japonicus]ROR53139.1 H+/gluconate symporter-like permease [Luteococcus japonicus]